METSPKKIFVVFNSLNIGGIETKIVDLCRYYSKQKDIQLTLLLKQKTGPLISKIPPNITIISPLNSSPVYFPLWLSIQFFYSHPQLVVSFGNYSSICTIFSKLFFNPGIKVIISEDSSIIEQIDSDTFPGLRRLLVKITYPLANLIITLTKAGKNKLVKLVPNTKNKTIILNNWLPLSFKSTGISKKDIDILYIGRFEPQKNPLAFLIISKNLIKTIPGIKIVMIGQGSLRTIIQEFIIKNKLVKNISLLPATTHPEKFYQRSKILLLTSRHEGFPLTILEAISGYCLPVCRQLRELDNFFNYKKKSLLFNSSQSAIDLINRLFSSPELRKDLIHHYWKKVIKQQNLNFNKTLTVFSKYL